MLWTNKRRPQAAIAALLGMTLAGTAMAAPLVVRSAGPSAKSYPAGRSIPDGSKITLKAGDTLVLLDGRGTRTLSGPGSFNATATATAAASTGTTLSALVSGGGERRARIGAVRSVRADTGPASNPNVWYVDISRSSNMCVADPSTVTIWRPDAATPATVTVTRSDGATGKIELAAGQPAEMWPASLPVTDGSQFKLSWAGAKAPTALKFIVVKPSSPDLTDLAQSLIKAGCNAQLDMLIKTVALPDGSNKG